MIERIRQLYKIHEGRLRPVPWCEEFSFKLNEIFTRLRIVGKDKTRGEMTNEIFNMTAVLKPHEECEKPRTVFIEGDPSVDNILSKAGISLGNNLGKPGRVISNN